MPTEIVMNAQEMAWEAAKDLGREVKLRYVIAGCLYRIMRWTYHPGCEDPSMVRDTSHFYSAFPGYTIPDSDIEEALDDLVDEGFISLTYHDPDTDPTGFVIRLLEPGRVSE